MPANADLMPKLIKWLNLHKVFLCLLAILYFQSPLNATEPYLTASIQKSASYLYDPGSKFSIDEIRSPRFMEHFQPFTDFHQAPGLKSGALWLRVTVSNTDSFEYKGVLSFDAPQLGSVRIGPSILPFRFLCHLARLKVPLSGSRIITFQKFI
jgi:hypothetical protein